MKNVYLTFKLGAKLKLSLFLYYYVIEQFFSKNIISEFLQCCLMAIFLLTCILEILYVIQEN